ncbi:MAG: hypothetical protein DWQ01_18450 [Planctomycetota bacterium]|nr:MAG: hypothetical protein DWQ01_18450 [Planctomycetota bacterium]
MEPKQTSERKTDTQRKLIRALFQWRWTAIGFFVVFFGFLMLIAYTFPPMYQVEAKVLVKPGRQNAPELPVSMSDSAGFFVTSQEDVNSEIEILMSRAVRAVAVDRIIADRAGKPPSPPPKFLEIFVETCQNLGLFPKLSEREQMILKFGNKVSVDPIPLTNVFEIKYKKFSAKDAERDIRYILDAYLAEHAKVHRLPGSEEFFEEKAEEIDEDLQKLEDDLTRFRVENDGGDLTLKRSLLLESLTAAEQLQLTLTDISEGQEELISDAGVLENREIAFNRERLLQLKLDLAQARLRFNEDSTQVTGIKDQINAAREALTESLTRMEKATTRNVNSLREQLREVEQKRAEYDRLVAQRDLLKNEYLSHKAKATEESINRALDEEGQISVRVIQWPSVPERPWFPDRFLMAIFGLILAIPGAICAALLRAYLHSRVETVSDVEKELGTPVLASIRKLRASAVKQGRATEMAQGAVLVQGTLAREMPEGGVLHVAASGLGEGASSFAAALARVGAEGNQRIILAQVDPRNPGVPAADDSEEALLAGLRESEQIPGLQLLPLAGLSLDQAGRSLQAAKQRSDWVILDGPPLASGGGGGAYATLADASILVISGVGVHLEVARRGLDVLRRLSPKVLGAVLNRRAQPVPGLLYRRV